MTLYNISEVTDKTIHIFNSLCSLVKDHNHIFLPFVFNHSYISRTHTLINVPASWYARLGYSFFSQIIRIHCTFLIANRSMLELKMACFDSQQIVSHDILIPIYVLYSPSFSVFIDRYIRLMGASQCARVHRPQVRTGTISR